MKNKLNSIFDGFCEIVAGYFTLKSENSSDLRKTKKINRAVGFVLLTFLVFIAVAAAYNNLIR